MENVAVFDIDDDVRVHRISDGKEIWSNRTAMERPLRLVFSPDGTKIAVMSDPRSSSGSVKVLDAEGGNEIFAKRYVDPVAACEFRPDSEQIAISRYERGSGIPGRGTVGLYELEANTEIWNRSCDGIPLTAFSPNGLRLYLTLTSNNWLVGSARSSVACWSLDGRNVDELWTAERDKASSFPVPTPDGKHVLTGGPKELEIRDALSGDALRSLPFGMYRGRFDRSGRRLIVKGDDIHIRILDWPSGDMLALVRQTQKWYGNADFVPDGDRVVSSLGGSSALSCSSIGPASISFLDRWLQGDVNRVGFLGGRYQASRPWRK